MKTKEELNALKEEFETVSKKLRELTEDELRQVTGGMTAPPLPAKELDTSGLFNGCTSPDTVGGLPATSIPVGDTPN